LLPLAPGPGIRLRVIKDGTATAARSKLTSGEGTVGEALALLAGVGTGQPPSKGERR